MTDIDRALDLLRSANPVVTVDDLDGGELAASIAMCERVVDGQAREAIGGVAVVGSEAPPAPARSIPTVRPLLVPAAAFAIVVVAIATIAFGSTLMSPTIDPGVPAAPVTTIAPTDDVVAPDPTEGHRYEVAIDRDRVYWTDGDSTYTVDVYYPIEAEGPWPVVVVFPDNAAGATNESTARAMAARGAVAFAPVSVLASDVGDPELYVSGALFDRGSCAVGFAQAHSDEYGGDPARTSVIGAAGGEHHAAWAALGLTRTDVCDDPIRFQPIGLVAGMPQWLFQASYWDEHLADTSSMARDTVDRFWNPQRWAASDDLRVHIWTTASPAESRVITTPLTSDSWIHLRDTTGTLVDDLRMANALADGEVRFEDNARTMYLVMATAGISITLDQMSTEGWAVEKSQHDRMWEVISTFG